jgi:signal transduction histidine kinase
MPLRRSELLAGAAGVAVAIAFSSSPAHLPAAILIGAALATAERWPRATWVFVALVTVTASAVQSALPGDGDFTMYALLAAHGAAVGRFESGRCSPAGAAALTAAGLLGSELAHSVQLIYAFLVPSAWAAGCALRERSLIASRLKLRERELEEERDAFGALSVRYERARIASELHDIVAHAISVMVVQAGAGQRLATRDRAATAETFAAIADAARRAESDLARLVDLLSDTGRASVDGSSDLALVRDLVTGAKSAGLEVTLRLRGDLEQLDEVIASLVHRVVQEGLTNALRYAPGAPITVEVVGEAGALFVEVANGRAARSHGPLADAGTGNGIRGLRERIGERGGSVAAGPTNEGWHLAARVPQRREEASWQ